MRIVTWTMWAAALALGAAPSGARAGQLNYRAKLGGIRRMLGNPKALARARTAADALAHDEAAPLHVRTEAVELRGWVFEKLGQREAAAEAWREAERMAAGIEKAIPRMRRLVAATAGYVAVEQWDDCVRAAGKAHDVAVGARDRGVPVQMQVVLSVAHKELGDAEASQASWQRALAHLRTHGDRAATGWVVEELAKSGLAAVALEFLAQALDDRPLAGVAPGARTLGDRLREANDLEGALRAYRLGASSILAAGWQAARVRGARRACRQRLVEIELERGKLESALQHAKLLYLHADVRKLADAMSAVSIVLRRMDKGEINRRVRRFLEFQRYGPAGQDGQPGSADDLKDPLAAVPLPQEEPVGLLEELLAETKPLECALRSDICMQHREYRMALAEALAGYRSAVGEALSGEIYRVATALKAIDGHVARANRYLLYQKHGPVGLDGKLGTEDDLTDPLAGVEPAAVPGSEKLFAEAVAACDQSYKGLRQKGRLLLAWGKADEGLAVLREAYARCGVTPESLKEAILGVAGALKAIDGHVLRANQYLLYQKHGPAGPDGIEGNEDDPTNPLDALPAPEAAPRNAK